MKKLFMTIAAASALALQLPLAQAQHSSSEAHAFLLQKDRWAVKTGADAAARYLRAGVTQPTRVKKLIPIERPSELPLKAPSSKLAQINRYSDTENKVFSIDADIIRYRVDPEDRDIHIVIRDHDDIKAEDAPADSGERRTMIAKIPDPSVVVQSSPWRSSIVRVRREFEQKFRPSAVFTEQVVHVKITGVGFFDYLHGQNGMALNGLELHPVLSLEFIDDGETAVPSTARITPAPIKMHVTSTKPPIAPAVRPVEPRTPAVKPQVTISKVPITPSPRSAETRSPVVSPQTTASKPPTARVKTPIAPTEAAPLMNHAGQVWINLSNGTFWQPGSRFYGKTKRGRYMSEDDAINIGFIPGIAPK